MRVLLLSVLATGVVGMVWVARREARKAEAVLAEWRIVRDAHRRWFV